MQAGLLLAQAKGYFRAENLHVDFTYPKNDDSTIHDEVTKAVDELCNKRADMAIIPSDCLIYNNTRRSVKHKLVAVGTLAQKDFFGIGTIKSEINRPKDLDGKTYASTGLKFHAEMVREMIRSDGGKGELKDICIPPVKDLYPGLKEGRWDASCVSVPVHEPMAKRDNQRMKVFCFNQYNIPRTYTTLLCVREDTLHQKEKKECIKLFLKAAKKGHQDLFKMSSEEVARLLREEFQHPNMKDSDLMKDCIERAKEFIFKSTGEKKGWGRMEEECWKKFVEFLVEKKILLDEEGKPIGKEIDMKTWFTNELLDREHD
jgi:NitT/TauT family transport system substrate-binding protein